MKITMMIFLMMNLNANAVERRCEKLNPTHDTEICEHPTKQMLYIPGGAQKYQAQVEKILEKAGIEVSYLGFDVGVRLEISKQNAKRVSKALQDLNQEIQVLPAWGSQGDSETVIYDIGEVVCGYQTEPSVMHLITLTEKAQAEVSRIRDYFGVQVTYKTLDTFKAYRALASDPSIKYCSPNFIIQAPPRTRDGQR